jgi:hypothetical protein
MKKGIVLLVAIAMAFIVGGIAGYAFAADPIIVGSVNTPGYSMNVVQKGRP